MLGSFGFWLVVLTGLLGYLCSSLLLRWYALRRRERESQVPGRVLDVSEIAPRVERVRQNYIGFGDRPRKPSFTRTFLVERARRVVGALAYFHPERGEMDAEKSGG